MGFNKDAVIVAQNSATGAATIVAALINQGILTSADEVLATFEDIRGGIFEGSFALAGVEDVEAMETTPAFHPRRASSGGARRSSGGRSSGGGSGDPGTVDFRGGKYAGKTIGAVYDEDPDYLDWCVANLKNDFMVGRIEAFLATAA